jgi:hypothetical protein
MHKQSSAQPLVSPSTPSCALVVVRLDYPCGPLPERVADRHLTSSIGVVGITFNNVRHTASAFGGLPENNHSSGSVRLGIGPHPVADLWHVFQLLARIRGGLGNPGSAFGD